LNWASQEYSGPPEQELLGRPRRELQAVPQVFDGQPYWVIKDPLSLRYYRLNREEYFIFEQLRGGVTLEQLKEAHRKEFRSDLLTNQDIAGFVRSLTAKNLLLLEQPDRDEKLFRNAKSLWRRKFKAQLGNFMFFKIPLYDPDRLFNRVIDHLRFIWTRRFFLFYLCLLALALVLIIRRWDDFSVMFSNRFFTLYNMPLLFVSIWIIQALHEFGHGLTCKNYGGEVHEMGWLFLVFMPFLYCNVTDAWTFAQKGRRLLVTAAGIMTEVFFASLATIVWYFTDPPSFIHSLSFNIVIVCSISTILFNANPLLKYDGYYMLMDLIEIPNLRQRASAFVRNFLVRYVLGGRGVEMSPEHKFRFIFPLYSLAAYCYRWFILFAILFFVYTMLKQARLVWLGRFVVAVSATTMIIVPLARTGAYITRRREALGISNTRLLVLLAGVILGSAGVMFWPLQHHVTLNFILEPVRVHWLRSQVDGKLTWSDHVREGVWIDPNSPASRVVAHLQNPELLCEEKKIAARIEQIKVDIAEYGQNRALDALLEQRCEQLKLLDRNRQRLQEQIANLQVKAPFAGELLTPDIEMTALSGCYIRRGAPLFVLGDTRELNAKVLVSEKNYARIFHSPDQLDQAAELLLYAFAKERFYGRVAAVSSERLENMGQFGEKLALSNQVGGEVLTEYDPASGQERPLEPVYEVTIELEQESIPAAARAYMAGRAHIDCGKSTLYQWAKDSILRFISPDVRL